jgi:hypothetical protein
MVFPGDSALTQFPREQRYIVFDTHCSTGRNRIVPWRFFSLGNKIIIASNRETDLPSRIMGHLKQICRIDWQLVFQENSRGNANTGCAATVAEMPSIWRHWFAAVAEA